MDRELTESLQIYKSIIIFKFDNLLIDLLFFGNPENGFSVNFEILTFSISSILSTKILCGNSMNINCPCMIKSLSFSLT